MSNYTPASIGRYDRRQQLLLRAKRLWSRGELAGDADFDAEYSALVGDYSRQEMLAAISWLLAGGQLRGA